MPMELAEALEHRGRRPTLPLVVNVDQLSQIATLIRDDKASAALEAVMRLIAGSPSLWEMRPKLREVEIAYEVWLGDDDEEIDEAEGVDEHEAAKRPKQPRPDRRADVLQGFREANGWVSSTELAVALGITKATAHKHLQDFVAEGVAERREDPSAAKSPKRGNRPLQYRFIKGT
jgi:uncharacterized membrane protein